MLDAYTLARQTALYGMYKKNRLGGLFRVGKGSIHLIVTITSPISTQVTARHYDKNSKNVLLQWLEVRKVNGKETITGFQERFPNGGEL
jgi:hypothetical protein